MPQCSQVGDGDEHGGGDGQHAHNDGAPLCKRLGHQQAGQADQQGHNLGNKRAGEEGRAGGEFTPKWVMLTSGW